jgi:purine-binding chemotaxis protein CheW
MMPVNQAPEEQVMMPDAELNARLKARAAEYARLPVNRGSSSPTIEVITFMLGSEQYAMELHHIQEVIPLPELTTLPGTPKFVLGIINVRGQIISVIDLKTFFDLPQQGLTNRNRVIILHGQEMEFGILADEIHGISRMAADEIQTTLPTLTGVRQEYLQGVSKESVAILDAKKLLTDPKMIINH